MACQVFLLIAGCGRETVDLADAPADDRVLVARVGEEGISAEEFQLNYEFGHGHLRRGETPRRDVLSFMIYEKILAMEARQRNLDTAQAVVHALHMLREELLIERVFDAKVLANVVVTDEEIREAVNRTAVSFKFRFLPARNEADAAAMRGAVLERGWDSVLEERKAQVDEVRRYERELASPYVKAEDVEPDVLAVIQDLEPNTPSEPVLYNGQWYLFEVMDVRREHLAPDQVAEKAASARKVLYNEKAMAQGARFVAETMAPLNVTTKRAGFEILNDALWAWYSASTPERNLLHTIEEQGLDRPYTRLLMDHAGELLVTFGPAVRPGTGLSQPEEAWTIRTFLEHFTPGRYVIRADEPARFKARLADIVALVVRDAVFLEMAEREGLDDDPTYRRALAQWKDKWMFQALRDELLAQESTPNWTTVRRFVDSVSAAYGVEINEAVLDTIPLSVSEKNPYMTVHLFKNNANKMPFPIVDPNWKPAR